MPFPRRIDAFGFGDLLACRVLPACEFRGPAGQIALIQTTDHSSFSKRKDKLLALPEVAQWKAAGGIVLLHGWGKRGPRGKRKLWTLRQEVL